MLLILKSVPHSILHPGQIVGKSSWPPKSRGSLTLKLTGAYSRATGRCRVTLLGVRFRAKVRGECKEGKDGAPIAIPARSTHVSRYIESSAGPGFGRLSGVGAGTAAQRRSAASIGNPTGSGRAGSCQRRLRSYHAGYSADISSTR